MGKFFKWSMFFTSFLPLWFSIIVIDLFDIIGYLLKHVQFNPLRHEQILCVISCISVPIITICVILLCSAVSIYGVNQEISKQKKNPKLPSGRITRAKKANKITTEFLLAYILPMIAFDYTNLKQIVLFLVYFTVLSFLCIRNNNIYTNILLEIKGYKMYDCDIECKKLGKTCCYKDSLVISKNDLTQSLPHKIRYFGFENYIYIEIEDVKNE